MKRLALSTLLAIVFLPLAHAQPAADIIVWNGPIYTGVDDAPRIEAIAARRGVITFAGARADAEKLKGPRTQIIDLRGAAAFPGFQDAHAHFRGIGARELTLNLEGLPSLAATVEAVKRRAAETPAGGAVIGRGWHEGRWLERRALTTTDLDAVAPDHPVLLMRGDGHSLVANTKALQAAGITKATVAPEGGAIGRGADGELNGILVDNAMGLVAALADQGEPSLNAALDAAFKVYPSRGWVGLHNMSVGWDEVLALERRVRRTTPTLRIYNAVTPEAADQLFASGPRRSADGRIQTRAIKFYMDGSLGSRSAALFAPYADRPNETGLLLQKPETALPLYERALRRGLQIATHGIGDRGNAMVLDLYADAFTRVPEAQRRQRDPRWRVEHAQHLRSADIPRFAQLRVIASMQPSHAISDLHFAQDRLGVPRLAGSYAWSSLIASGAIVTGGSDAPVEKGDPLIEFYAAVARKDLQGFQGPNWHAEEAVSRAAALRMFTFAPAYAAFEDHMRGRLVVGQRADVSVFSVDLMTAPVDDIPKGRALMTIIDGKPAWRADGW